MNSNKRQINTVMVIGAGIMGHGIAQFLALKNINVILVDNNDDRLNQGLSWINDNLDYMIELEELNSKQKSETISRIKKSNNVLDYIDKVDMIIEAIIENLSAKLDLWKLLDEHAQVDTILTSNTSSYDINELSSVVQSEERVIGTHWFHPPPITPCVEVIPADKTSKETIDLVLNMLTNLGKVPTVCKSAPGFVANRLQMALAAEALALVEEGLAEPKDIDRIVKTSFGFRLGAYGPFEIADQAGADTYLGIFDYLYEKLGKEHFKPSDILRRQVKGGRLGIKSNGGFYDYGPDGANQMRRDRDKKYYARLNLVKNEN